VDEKLKRLCLEKLKIQLPRGPFSDTRNHFLLTNYRRRNFDERGRRLTRIGIRSNIVAGCRDASRLFGWAHSAALPVKLPSLCCPSTLPAFADTVHPSIVTTPTTTESLKSTCHHGCRTPPGPTDDSVCFYFSAESPQQTYSDAQ